VFVFGLRLKIERACVNDTGWYSCEGFNHYGHQSTTSYLLVLPGTIYLFSIYLLTFIKGCAKYSSRVCSSSTKYLDFDFKIEYAITI